MPREFLTVTSDTGGSGKSLFIQNENHKRSVGNAVILAADSSAGSGFKSETRVVFGVSQNDDEFATILAEPLQPGFDQCPSDTRSLPIRGDRHRCEAVASRHHFSISEKLNR